MGRSIFTMGFAANPWMGDPGEAVGPLHINLTREEIERKGRELLKLQPVKPGWVGSYPKIVKVNNSGEYIVYADGSAQYIDYKTGNVGATFQI